MSSVALTQRHAQRAPQWKGALGLGTTDGPQTVRAASVRGSVRRDSE